MLVNAEAGIKPFKVPSGVEVDEETYTIQLSAMAPQTLAMLCDTFPSRWQGRPTKDESTSMTNRTNMTNNEPAPSGEPTPVFSELQQLHVVLSTNEDLVSALNVRLVQVMSSTEACKSCDDALSIGNAESSNLERVIAGMTRKVNDTNEMLRNILSDLRI